LRFSPLGSSIEKGVENPFKRLRKRSSVAAADDIPDPRILLVPIDDGPRRRLQAGAPCCFALIVPRKLGLAQEEDGRNPGLPLPGFPVVFLKRAAIIAPQ
jgi:hypothetical protein